MRKTNTAPLPAATHRRSLADVTFDGTISALWKQGLDTCAISRAMGQKDFPESRVANRVAELQDASRL